jgi:hypothetical protein
MYDELLGQDFGWFAFDNIGQIAIFFTAGQGIIPHLIGNEYTTHQLISSEFELPNWGSLDVWDDYAAYGFYVYDWQLQAGSYCRERTPLAIISTELKSRITAIKNIPILNLNFGSTPLVDVVNLINLC